MLNNQLEYLVTLVGEDQAAKLLAEAIRTRVSGTPTPVQFGPTKRVNPSPLKERKTRAGGTRVPISPADRELISNRGRQLYPQLQSFTKVSQQISREINGQRSPAAVYNILWGSGVISEINGKKQEALS